MEIFFFTASLILLSIFYLNRKTKRLTDVQKTGLVIGIIAFILGLFTFYYDSNTIINDCITKMLQLYKKSAEIDRTEITTSRMPRNPSAGSNGGVGSVRSADISQAMDTSGSLLILYGSNTWILRVLRI